MSSDTKGTRKTKKTQGKGTPAAGNQKMTTELVISLLVAGLYAVFLVEAALDKSVTALMLSGFLFVSFIVFTYIVRGGKHKSKKAFGSLLYVFLGLSALSLIWQSLLFFGVVDAAKFTPAIWILVVGVAFAAASAVLIAAIALLEKVRLDEIYLTGGDFKVIPFAVVAFLLCALLGVGAAYLLFGGAALGTDKLVTVIGAILLFSLIAGISEELWFRGLMLSRIIPLLGESTGNIYQALVFGVFEAVMFYLITGQANLMPAIFIIGAMTGYYWGRATLRSKSLISPMLLHAGFYVLVTMPILIGLMA